MKTNLETIKKSLDYLFEMYHKYAPTKNVEGIECYSKEGSDWLDSIIMLKRLAIIVETIKSVNNLICEEDFVEENGKYFFLWLEIKDKRLYEWLKEMFCE